jgi:hypothetical protein
MNRRGMSTLQKLRREDEHGNGILFYYPRTTVIKPYQADDPVRAYELFLYSCKRAFVIRSVNSYRINERPEPPA